MAIVRLEGLGLLKKLSDFYQDSKARHLLGVGVKFVTAYKDNKA
jgi:hypothetical protein